MEDFIKNVFPSKTVDNAKGHSQNLCSFMKYSCHSLYINTTWSESGAIVVAKVVDSKTYAKYVSGTDIWNQ